MLIPALLPAIILSDIVSTDSGVASLIISSVIAAIGLIILFLMGRFIKSYDSAIKGAIGAATRVENESLNRDNKIHERIDEVCDAIDKIKELINRNVADRERQVNEIDRRSYEARIMMMQQLEQINIVLAQLKERIIKAN